MTTLKDPIVDTIIALDEVMAGRDVPLSERVYRVAMFIWERCVEFDPESGPKLGFVDDIRFGAFYHLVRKWYWKTYGAVAMCARTTNSVRLGFIALRGVALRIDVPTTITSPSKDDDTDELRFPVQAEGGEDVLKMISPRPRLSGLDKGQRQKFAADVLTIVGALRRIWIRLITASGPEPGTGELKNAFLDQLDGVVHRLRGGGAGAVGAALFDLRMCCELGLKLHLLQLHGTFRHIHHFEELLPAASDDMRDLFDRSFPVELQRYATVNVTRYGKRLRLTITEFFGVYMRTLRFLEDVVDLVKGPQDFGGMRATMRKPAWAGLGPDSFSFGPAEDP